MVVRAAPSGPVIGPHNMPVGTLISASTLADLNARPTWVADSVFLHGLDAVDDGAGGLFRVTAGGADADGKDILNLTGVHAPKQLRRVTNHWAFGGVFPAGGGTTTIAAANSAVPLTAASFFPLNGTDFTLNAAGVLTSTRRVPYRARVTVQGALDVAAPGATDEIRCATDYNGQGLGTAGPGVVPPAQAVNNRAYFSSVQYFSAVSFGDTFQLIVANLTAANDVSLLSASALTPIMFIERVNTPDPQP